MEAFKDLLTQCSISGGVCAFVSGSLNPVDVTKIRLQNQSGEVKRYQSMIGGMRLIFKEEGAAGLAKGIVPSMYRDLFYSGIRMGAYNPIRDAIYQAIPHSVEVRMLILK